MWILNEPMPLQMSQSLINAMQDVNLSSNLDASDLLLYVILFSSPFPR